VPFEPGTFTFCEKLKNAKGGEFDRLYAQIIGINAHKDVLALFRSQAKDGKDPQLKAFA
jgi:putative membrane protein